jgi:Septum formation
MPRPSNPDTPDDAIGEPEPISDHLILDPAHVSVARNDYDPASLFRSKDSESGSVTVAASAADARMEWLTERTRYGHFSGRPLDPEEIAAEYRRQRLAKWSRWGVLVAAALSAVWLFVWNLNNDPWLPLSAAEPGTCFQDSLSSVIVREEIRYEVRTTVEEVDCAVPHQFEMIGMVPMSGFGDTTTMADTADRLCAPLFEDYMGAPAGEAEPWKMASFPPYLMFVAGEQAACLAYQGEPVGATDDAYEPIMVEGSVREGAAS